MKFTKAEIKAALTLLHEHADCVFDDELGADIETPMEFLQACAEQIVDFEKLDKEAK